MTDRIDALASALRAEMERICHERDTMRQERDEAVAACARLAQELADLRATYVADT